MSEPTWLDPDQIAEINFEIVKNSSEAHFIRDAALLEMACVRPQNVYAYEDDDVARLAAELLFGIASCHPFEQGNKRTALVAAETFLRLNGFDLILPDREYVATLIVDVITDRAPLTDLADLFDDHMN